MAEKQSLIKEVCKVLKKALPILMSIMILFSISSLAFADNSPQDAIKENKMKFQQLNDKILGVNAEVSTLNTQIDVLNQKIQKNNSDIKENQKQIDTLQKQIDALNSEIAKNQEIADKRVRAMYKNNNNEGYISILLSSKSLGDLFSRFEAVDKIAAFDKQLLTNLKNNKDKVSSDMESVNSKNKVLQQLNSDNENSLNQLKSKKSQLQSAINDLNAQKQAAAQLIQDNEEKLISHSLSVIDSNSSSIDDVRDAIATLTSLKDQLNTASVRDKAVKYIKTGQDKLAKLQEEEKNRLGAANRGINGMDAISRSKTSYSMSATAYTGGGITALGLRPAYNPSGLSTIAVDPNVIPLGTKVFIPGYGYAICADTGGAIIGNIIDLYMNSEADCNNWGRRTVTVYIIAYPGEW